MDARSEHRLEVELHSRLDSVSPEDWDRLFVGFPDSLAMVQMVQASGFDGMKQHSIVVKSCDKPILLLPLFDTLHKVEFLYRGWGHQWLYQIAPFFPRLFHPRILGVGFVEGEWGQVGYDPEVSLDVLEEGWKLALETLNIFAHTLKSDLISFVDFNTESGKMLPVALLKNYTQVESYPCGVLPITFSSVEEYIGTLSKHMRKDLRRKMKSLNEIEVVRTTEIAPYLDRVFYLYQETIARSDLKFGVQRKTYFEKVCEAVSGTFYTLYFYQGELIAFNLLVNTQNALVDKYFGMEKETGRALNLYFVSWIENLQYCLDHQIPLYHAGPAAATLKHRLGAKMTSCLIAFRHLNPLAQKVLEKLSGHLAFEHGLTLEPTVWGTLWRNSNESPMGEGADESFQHLPTAWENSACV